MSLRLPLSAALLLAALASAALPAAALLAAGGAGIRFREASADWGVDFRHRHGGRGDFYMIETMGSGVAVLDYDGDGDHDLFFVDSGDLPRPAADAGGRPPAGSRSALYRNDGAGRGGRFVRLSGAAGIAVAGYGMGATAGDVDADGDLDLYVTAFGRDQLFENRGDGTFADATAAAGLGNELWGASAAFGDPDLDGDLDLYVANYVDFSFDDNPLCGKQELGLRSYCHPDVYDGLPDRYYRNRGDGTFEEAAGAVGIAPADGKGLGLVFGDVDLDGLPDLYVANDMTANFLFINRGGGRFEEVGVLAGAAFSDRGEPEAGMGVALGDVDGDARPEIYVTHLDGQTNALYSAIASGTFVDRRFPARVGEPSMYRVGFGAVLADFDLDADPDLAVANGHIIHNIEQWGTGTTYAQANQVLANDGSGVFSEVEGAGLDLVRVSRGMAAGDLDGDGDVDLAVSSSDDRAEVWENVGEREGRWLAVDLRRGGGSEPFGVGARLTVEVRSSAPVPTAAGTASRRSRPRGEAPDSVPAPAGADAPPSGAGRRQVREVRTGSSYMSQNALTVTFGLGAGQRPALEVRWPDGRRQRFEGVPADRRVMVVRP